MNEHVIDHGGERLVSSTGVVLMALYGWRVDHAPKCREALERYCQYLALHGYGRGSQAIWRELAAMPDRQAAAWAQSTFERFVSDPAAAVEYVLGKAVRIT